MTAPRQAAHPHPDDVHIARQVADHYISTPRVASGLATEILRVMSEARAAGARSATEAAARVCEAICHENRDRAEQCEEQGDEEEADRYDAYSSAALVCSHAVRAGGGK